MARKCRNLEEEIIEAYAQLRGTDGRAPDVAVRSSAIAEDLPDASFAGQQETYLNDGVGLAREEFIITTYIKVHPLALLAYAKLGESPEKAEIDRITAGYEDTPQFYVDKLAQGLAIIAAAFYSKDVILRLSDFKTNEYPNLIGGHAYEPKEENPMIGFRGASRYYNPRYQAGFALECRAMKKVRDEMGLKNLKLTIPFCRTVAEGVW